MGDQCPDSYAFAVCSAGGRSGKFLYGACCCNSVGLCQCGNQADYYSFDFTNQYFDTWAFYLIH